MTRILVIGVGPRPGQGQNQVFAPGLRLKTIVTELVRAGHDVTLGEALFSGKEPEKPQPPPTGIAAYSTLSSDPEKATEQIGYLAVRARPQAMVVLTDGLALAAAQTKLYDGPLYVDYNGHPMAERQMQASIHNSNEALAKQWLYVLPVLLRADMFATCSDAQRLALIGELGAAGRINKETCSESLVHVLRPPLPFDREFEQKKPGILRGKVVAENSRVILFTGGYNTWLDEEMLFNAVEHVMAKEPRAVYVSTGGGIEGHVTKVFDQFKARVEKSEYRDRYHFLGWLDHDDYVECCLEADVGVLCDKPTLEGELGCRNRVYGWIWGGMRVVATDLPEIVGYELGPLRLVDAVPTGDQESFSSILLKNVQLGRHTEEELSHRRDLLRRNCSAAIYYKDLVEWAKKPQRAPDREDGALPENPLVKLQSDFLEFTESNMESNKLKDEVRELILRLSGSKAINLYAAMHPETKTLLDQLYKKFVLDKKE